MAVKILHDVIREKRNDCEMSMKQLSDESGVHVSTIKALESGRSNTTYENISKIAEVLRLDIDEIYLEGFKETKVITIANNKGGSAKTTSVTGLGYSLSRMGYKILLIDGDGQMNLTSSFGLERNLEKNLNAAIIDETLNLQDYIVSTEYENIDIIISDFYMAEIEQTLFTKAFRESVLKVIFTPVIEMAIYDFIIIDTNPTLGLLNFNILNFSDYVIIPVEMTAYGVMGLEVLTGFITKVRRSNPELKLLGVLRTKVDIRESITKEVDMVLTEVFGDAIFKSVISVDTNIKKAQWDRTPLQLETRAKEQYFDLAKEVVSLV